MNTFPVNPSIGWHEKFLDRPQGWKAVYHEIAISEENVGQRVYYRGPNTHLQREVQYGTYGIIEAFDPTYRDPKHLMFTPVRVIFDNGLRESFSDITRALLFVNGEPKYPENHQLHIWGLYPLKSGPK